MIKAIVDGDTAVHDSWKIAQYLEATYPARPSLFGDTAIAQLRFLQGHIRVQRHSLSVGREGQSLGQHLPQERRQRSAD